MAETVEALISYCRENGRVCPVPMKWDELWRMLPDRSPQRVGWEPPLPMILAGWDAPDLAKMQRLEQHLLWAERHGALKVVAEYLRGLTEQDWHHIGD